MFSPEVFLEKLQQELNNVCIERINFRTISNFYKKFCNFFQACNRLTEQQVNQLADCCVKYIECIRSYVENHSELTKRQVETVKQFIQIVEDIPKLVGIKDEYMKWITTPLLEKAIDSDIRSWFGKEILKNYNRAVQGTKKDLRNDIAERNIVYLCKLADLLCCCGDFDYQVTLMETIFRMCSMDQIKNHAHTLFPESEMLQNGICNINNRNFDVDMRIFVNTVNSKFKSVLSVESQFLLLDNIQVRAPKDADRNNLALWVDFNLIAETITILCDKDSLKTSSTEDTESGDWETITINISNITYVLMSSLLVEDAARALGSVLYFKLTPPCTVVYASSHAAAQATDFKLAILKCPELIQLETEVLPKMFGEKFSKLATSSQEENSSVESQELNVRPKRKGTGAAVGYKPLKTHISICRPRNVSSSASDAMSLKNRLQEVENYSFDKENKVICQSPKISNIKELVAKYNSEEKLEKKDMVGETGKMDRCETFDEAISPDNSKFVSDTISIDGNPIEETDMQLFEASDNILQLMNCSSNSVLALEFATSLEQIEDETDLLKEPSMNQKHHRGKKIWDNANKIKTEDEPKISLCVPSNHCNTLSDNVQVIEGIEPVEESDKEQSKTQGYGGDKKIYHNFKHSIQTKDEPKISLCVPSNHCNTLCDNVQVIEGIEPVEESDKEQSKTQGYGGEKKIYKNSENSIQTKDEPKMSLCVPSNHCNTLCDNVQVIEGIEPVEESDKEQSKTQGYDGEKKIYKNSKNSIQTKDEPKISLCVPSNHSSILRDNVHVIDGIEPVEESDKEQSKTQGYGGDKKIYHNSKHSIQTRDEPKISLCVPSNHCNTLCDNVQVIEDIELVEESDKEQSKTQGYDGEKKICKNSKNSIKTEDEPKISLCVPSNYCNTLCDNVQVIQDIELVEESDKEQSKTQGYGGEKKIYKNSKNSSQTKSEPKISLCVPSNHSNILRDNVHVIDGIEPVEESDREQSKTQGYDGEKKICKNSKNSIQTRDEPKISLCVPSNHCNTLCDNVHVIDGIEPVEESDKEQSKTQGYDGEKKIWKNSKNSIKTEDEPKISLCVPSNHCNTLCDKVQVIQDIELVEESDKVQSKTQGYGGEKKIYKNSKNSSQTKYEPKISLCVPSNPSNILRDNVHVIDGIEPVEERDKGQSKTQGYDGEKKICKNSKNSIQTRDEPKISLCVPSNHSSILRDNVHVIDGIEPVEESDKEQSKTQGYDVEKKICKNSKNSIQTKDEPKISLRVPSNPSNILRDNVHVIDGIEPVEERDKEQSKTQGYDGEKKICKNSKNSIQTKDEPKISLCVPSNHSSILRDNVHVIDGIEPVEESDKEQSKTQGYGGEKKIYKNSKNSIQTKYEPEISLCVPSNHSSILRDNVHVIDGIEPVEESDKEQSKTQGYDGERKICKNSKNSIKTEDEPKISLCVPSNHCNTLCDNVQVIEDIELVEESDKEQSKTQGYGGATKICKNSKNSIQTKYEPKISLCMPSEKSHKKIKSSKEVIKVKWLAPKCSMSKSPIVDKTETLKQKKLLKSSVKKFKVTNNSQQKSKRKIQQKINDDNHTEINEDKENSSVFANASLKETQPHIEVVHKDKTTKKIENTDNSFHEEMLPETKQNEIKSSEPSIVDDIKTIKNKSFRARASKLQTKNIKFDKKQITKEKQSTAEKSLKVEVIKGRSSKSGNKKLNERTSYSIPADINKICVIEYGAVDVEDNTLPIHKNQYDSEERKIKSADCTALEDEKNTSALKNPEKQNDNLFELAKLSISEEETEDKQPQLEKSSHIVINDAPEQVKCLSHQSEGMANKNECTIKKNTSAEWVLKKCSVVLSKLDCQTETRTSQKRKLIDNDVSDQNSKSLTEINVVADDETPKIKKSAKKGVSRRLFNLNADYTIMESSKGLVMNKSQIINTENSVQDKDISKCNDLQSELMQNNDINQLPITKEQEEHLLQNEIINKADVNSNINEHNDYSINNMTTQNLSKDISEINIESPRKEMGRQQINNSEKSMQANMFEQFTKEKTSNSVNNIDADAISTAHRMDSSTNVKESKIASSNHTNKNSEDEYVLKTPIKNTSHILQPPKRRGKKETYGTTETNAKLQKALSEYCEKEDELLFDTNVRGNKVATNDTNKKTEIKKACKTPGKNVLDILQPPKKTRKKETLPGYFEKEDGFLSFEKQSSGVMHKSKFELCMESVLESLQEIHTSSSTYVKKSRRSLKDAKYKSLKSNKGKPKESIDKPKRRASTSNHKTMLKQQLLKMVEKEKKLLSKNIQQSHRTSPLSYADIDHPLKKTSQIMTDPVSKMQQNTFTQKANVKNRSSVDISSYKEINGTVNHSESIVENFSSGPSVAMGTKRKRDSNETAFEKDELILDWIESGTASVAMEGLKSIAALVLHQHNQMYEVLSKVLLPLKTDNDEHLNAIYTIANEFNRRLKAYFRQN